MHRIPASLRVAPLAVVVALAAAIASAAAPVTVTTVTETLSGGVGGVAVDALGFVYVADFGERVRKISPFGDVEVLTDTMYGASGTTVDGLGRVYQSSFNGGTVSRIDRDGSVATVAAGLAGPVGIDVSEDGSLTVCECRANRLARVMDDGQVSVFAESPLFACPNGITRAADGALYVVNFSDGRVLTIDDEGQVREHAVTGPVGQGHITFGAGALWVAGFRSNRIYRVGLDGSVETIAGSGRFASEDGVGLEASFSNPNGIAYDSTRDVLYVNDFLTPFTQRTKVPRESTLRRLAFPPLTEQLQGALESGGVEEMAAVYRSYKDSRPGRFTEIEANILGYTWLGGGKVEAALRLFELNAEDYPASFNTWDSLAEAHAAAGHRDEAIRFYRKSLDINPGNANAEAKLRELGADD